MPLEFRDLVLDESEYNPSALLADWAWLVDPSYAVLMPTALGHVFLERRDGMVWFLDTWNGRLEPCLDGAERFQESLTGDADFRERWLMPAVVAGLVDGGLRRGRGECYCPLVSPGFGGGLEPENFQTCAIGEHLAASAEQFRPSAPYASAGVEAEPQPWSPAAAAAAATTAPASDLCPQCGQAMQTLGSLRTAPTLSNAARLLLVLGGLASAVVYWAGMIITRHFIRLPAKLLIVIWFPVALLPGLGMALLAYRVPKVLRKRCAKCGWAGQITCSS